MTRFTRLFSSFRSQLCRFQFSQLTGLIRLPGLATLSLCLAFAPFQVAAQNMVIKGATILDVTNGDMIKNHVVIVKDGRIDAVSRRAQPISVKALRSSICRATPATRSHRYAFRAPHLRWWLSRL